MYIAIEDEAIVPKRFAVCDFYDVETCFCWDNDRLVIFPYTKDSSVGACDMRILVTPAPIRSVQFFDSRAFVICMPQSVYKLSRSCEFALLSKNALDMGGEFYRVLVAWNNTVYLDDKQDKSSTLLFPLEPNASETVCTFSLNPASTEPELVSCFAAGWETEGNLCLVAHHTKLYVLRGNAVQLVYTSDFAIVDILPVNRRDKVAGLLLLTTRANAIIFVHGRDDKLVFERVNLGENVKDRVAICASFNLCVENILWILCCDLSRLYYIRKEAFVDRVQEVKVEERTFTCMQYYKPNIILGLSQRKELVELSLEGLENWSASSNILLRAEMFSRTDVIMEKICAKAKELDALYENLTIEQDKLKRIGLYAAKQKLQLSPCIEVSRLCRRRYLGLSIPDKLPRNSYVVFTFTSGNQNTFCIKKVMETSIAIKMPINENCILHSSSIRMDLITLMNEQRPWCLIQNFISSPPEKKKRGRPKKDKTAFIDAKIATLRQLIAEKGNLSMPKLCEIKKSIRAQL
ncbi:PREDICTED: uncharacterized protein LOC105570065 [Vollenhovia emeryi]|uniref:uncharacterized protein LOC105570065 n=1 Tax=Vollenhovia emeryi TaxID=411798 RepID=UPI0005F3D49D|nr:PREDICTED: uncharacterized protein LOC105570065 [Vollenhovia emeryi]XP_011882397.1 PREDICTED: uncharacterized protein LOC105570065 [Vollenhovia emeryi]XP_011882398.1 PREDICTED: uncharacterized protein LOC105570065 [Vollenhovia emeryi]XP_011882399.1 PREDICTED: uncharacterized protein LOC105570065 [Vollenhovia emeryi]